MAATIIISFGPVPAMAQSPESDDVFSVVMNNLAVIVVGIIVLIILATGIKTIRPTHRMIVERLGKPKGVRSSGITYVLPFVEKGVFVNITEQMTDTEKQEIITKDNLNASV